MGRERSWVGRWLRSILAKLDGTREAWGGPERSSSQTSLVSPGHSQSGAKPGGTGCLVAPELTPHNTYPVLHLKWRSHVREWPTSGCGRVGLPRSRSPSGSLRGWPDTQPRLSAPQSRIRCWLCCPPSGRTPQLALSDCRLAQMFLGSVCTEKRTDEDPPLPERILWTGFQSDASEWLSLGKQWKERWTE